MTVYELPGPPIPLKRHRHSGKTTYDPQKKEKDRLRWYVLSQYRDSVPARDPFHLKIEFLMPIPQSISLKKAREISMKPHSKKPDLSNLIKFVEDCFNGILWEDDNLISSIEATKFYSESPKTLFKIIQV